MRVSRRAEPTAVAAWSARIVSSRRSSEPNPSSPSFERVMTPMVTPVVAHRDDEHRLVDVVGPGDRRAARIAVRVVDQDRLAVLGDPAGEALAELAGEQRQVDLLVRADARPRTRSGRRRRAASTR